MRELTAEEIQDMTAEQIAEFCRVQAEEELRQRKQEQKQAAQFAQVAMPYIEQGIPFDSFMSLTQAPSSFREAYEQIERKYQRTHTKSPEQAELQALEAEIAAAMGLSGDPQPQQAKPTATACEGSDCISSLALGEQIRRNRERAAALRHRGELPQFGVTGTA